MFDLSCRSIHGLSRVFYVASCASALIWFVCVVCCCLLCLDSVISCVCVVFSVDV